MDRLTTKNNPTTVVVVLAMSATRTPSDNSKEIHVTAGTDIAWARTHMPIPISHKTINRSTRSPYVFLSSSKFLSA